MPENNSVFIELQSSPHIIIIILAFLFRQDIEITGMKPQSKLWKQIPQQAAGYYILLCRIIRLTNFSILRFFNSSLITLRVAGLFNLPIPLRLAFGIGVSRIKL